ncbi:MAG: DEAD/DEAH box helicase [Pedobacter sp.]|nr:MAG: DEAD/DEAH box helicase [Pedobacter sp.]
MLRFEQTKISKPLITRMSQLGYHQTTDLQAYSLNRMIGGQDILAIAPGKSGKTTSYILALLTRIKQGNGDAPRALVLVPNKEKVLEVVAEFDKINQNKSIRIVGIHHDDPIDQQVFELTDGVDIVVAIPTRARAIYLKLGLNTNKINHLVLDDAEELVKQGMQLQVVELAQSIQKAQVMVFTNIYHERLEKMIEPFIKEPAILEFEEEHELKISTRAQLRYHVPNFRTKLNLLHLLLSDQEVFDKVVLFVNQAHTAETILKDLFNGKSNEVFLYKPRFYDLPHFESIMAFKYSPSARILIVNGENAENLDLSGIPFIFHVEIPVQIDHYIQRVLKTESEDDISILLTTDLELNALREIELKIGQKMDLMDLPEDLFID